MATATQAPASAEGPTSHTLLQPAGLAKLREKFPDDQIHSLPRIWCGGCRDSRTKVCENPQHRKAQCRDCGNYITTAHVDLAYVGHAELTNRLLDADPLWAWEPVAFDAQGLPVFDRNGGLWIRLTVCGHTRLGYGDSQGKNGPNAVKEAIGDALRNAAMRFGAALDLWAKSDLTTAQTEHPKSEADEPAPSGPSTNTPAGPPAADSPEPDTAQLDKLTAQAREHWDNALVLGQVKGAAEDADLLDHNVDGPWGWMRFEDILDRRLQELRGSKESAA